VCHSLGDLTAKGLNTWTHTIYVVFQSCGFVPRVLVADARSFHALATIMDWLTHLASISCWYRLDTRQDEFRLKLLYCEFQKYKVMTMSVIGGQPKKKNGAHLSCNTTKHVKCTFLISDYYKFSKRKTKVLGERIDAFPFPRGSGPWVCPDTSWSLCYLFTWCLIITDLAWYFRGKLW